jgi:cysteine-rich repeat protein
MHTPSVCETTCGDAILAGMEECDAPGHEGCSPTCTLECGWECEGPSCFTVCGDGVVSGLEECDDFNDFDGDGAIECMTICNCMCPAFILSLCCVLAHGFLLQEC